MKNSIKITLTVISLAGILVTIGWIFWKTELVYSFPTPLPVHYKVISNGSQINIDESFSFIENKPTLIHFFNPECPCSRFNMPHVKKLIKQFESKINFAMVVINNKEIYTESGIQKKYGISIPVSFDQSIAEKCGVYSTPQAVLIDENNQLYFRGNYNRNRYCTNKESEYVKMAIDSLLSNVSKPEFNILAIKAYGCSLPTCSK